MKLFGFRSNGKFNIAKFSTFFFPAKCVYLVSLWTCFLSELPTDQAQWGDLDGIVKMLEEVSNFALQEDQGPQMKRRKFCGEINALADMLRALDRYI